MTLFELELIRVGSGTLGFYTSIIGTFKTVKPCLSEMPTGF